MACQQFMRHSNRTYPEHINSTSETIPYRDHFGDEIRTNVGLTVAVDVTSEFEKEAEKASGK